MAYRPCPADVVAAGTVPRARCVTEPDDALPPSAILDLAEQASSRLRTGADPKALHAAALIDLVWAGEDGIPLERSVSYLRTASRLADHPAGVLTDLAAALLMRAERHQTPRDLLEAIETADRALDLEPRNAAARFNLALGLERLGLDGQAQRAWKGFLQVDSTSRWADDARRRPRPPVQAAATPAPPGLDASASEVSAYVDAAPEAAMLFGWDHALAEWGAAVMAGDSMRARSFLRLAGALGEQLERRGGDATLADAVRAIGKVAGRPVAARALAAVHREYAAGRTAQRAGRHLAAVRSFARVAATPGVSAPLAAWAKYQHADALLYEGQPEAADWLLRQIAAYADTLQYPSLAGRSRWVLATISLRSGRYEQAIHAARAAAPLFERAREPENVGAVQTMVADAEQYLPDRTETYTALHRAMTTLRPHRRSVWLHNVLYNAARLADADRFPRLAVRLQDEGVAVAEGIGGPIWIAEARIARARLLATVGRHRAAAEDVSAARTIVESLEPGTRRGWFEADLRLAEAAISLAAEPARAVAALDSAAAFFASQHNQIRLLPALVARSKAALALGNVPGATADLDRVLTLLDEQSTRLTSVELRASLVDGARQVVDRLVMLRVGAGDSTQALADLERARVSLAPVGSRAAKTRTALGPPPGEIAAEYALIGDTLLVWTLAGATVRLTRTTVERARLGRTIERVRASLELRADEPALGRDLAALYDWLVRPIQRQLGAPGAPLVLITDREIAAVPFAALRDTVQGRYLIEQHPLRFASSLRGAPRAARKGAPPRTRVLLVADPAFDRSAFPGLARLPGAAGEVQAIAAQYADTALLAGSAATRTAFEAELHKAGIVHYAGHAVFDDERPEQSLLVLAAGSEAAASARITAAELERLDLGSIRLVVLSACETIRSRSGRSGGFAGLASAFLAAGAGGVVGSLWRVDDHLTQELMREFHRAYGRSGDGAGALRAAQLRLLGSSDPALDSPAAWAGFRYAGS